MAASTLTMQKRSLMPAQIMFGGIWLGPGGGDRGDGHRADPGQANADATVAAAVAAGIRDFDTAPWYGSGASEERLGRAVRAVSSSEVRIFSKTGRLVTEASADDPTKMTPSLAGLEASGRPPVTERVISNDFTADGAQRSHAESMNRMGLPSVYGLRIHDPNDNSLNSHLRRAEGFTDEVAIAVGSEGMCEGLRRLRRDGAIKDVGVGMNCCREPHLGAPDEILRLLRGCEPGTFNSALLAGGWNLLTQAGLQCFEECEKLGVEVHVAGVFASGLLVSKAGTYAYKPPPAEIVEKVEKWRSLAEKHSCSLPAVAIAFAALPKCVSRVVVGMATPEQVAENMAWVKESGDVPISIWAEAKDLGLLDASIPVPAS